MYSATTFVTLLSLGAISSLVAPAPTHPLFVDTGLPANQDTVQTPSAAASSGPPFGGTRLPANDSVPAAPGDPASSNPPDSAG